MAGLRWFLLAASGTATAVAGYMLFLYAAQRSVLFPAPVPSGGESSLRLVGGQQVWLQLDGGRSEAWFLPSLLPGSATSPVVIFAHGNGELIDYWVQEFETPRRWGLSTLLVEYPGYGRSEGHPSEESLTAAMVAAYDWAILQPGLDPHRIIAYGRSVGGGAACGLARDRAVAALVLESTFTSVRSLARRYGLPGFLVRDPFDNLSVVRSYGGPVLIVHGERDDLIPSVHARALREAAQSAELHLSPCGHNDCPRPWSVLRRFLVERGIL